MSEIILETKRDEIKRNKFSNSVITFFLVVFLIVLLIIANIVGKQFMNMFMFSIMFGFPLIILYREKIATILPDNIANYMTKTDTEVKETVFQTNINRNPFYVGEVQVFVLALLVLSLAVYMLVKSRDKFVGLLTSILCTVLTMLLINDLF